MQLRHFHYFIAVAEEGSFLKAARRLRVAQPSLSKQIQDLEREIGALLFQRLPRGVRLTEAGRAFLLEARLTVENAARAVASARRADEDAVARLHFAHGRVGHYAGVLGELLAAFRMRHPETQVQIHRLNETTQRAALREHRVDIAATFTGSLPVPGFAVHALLNSSATGVLISSAHPLAVRNAISLPELRPLTYLHVPRRVSPEIYRIALAALLSRGLIPDRLRPRASDDRSAALHIATGNAWTLASAHTASAYANTDAIVYRPFLEPPIPFWLCLLWRLDSPAQVVANLIRVARELGMDATPRQEVAQPA
ncbi:MAG: LysR family transcriptional regulator [Gemmatimonadota bacterium]